jgi:cellulose synthase/poly-beta-1,6-N-acetylglucosamine synthase-like glycosyltransferase
MTPLPFLLAAHAILVYAWIVFPVLLLWIARRPRVTQAADRPAPLPHVAFILSAYNEEGQIGPRVRNFLAMDYPADRWHAFIGVDGARDRTAVEALEAAAGSPNISVFDFAENRGKVAVLKDLAARVSPAAEILAFTDANTEFEPHALRVLLAPFADPAVGGVCGKLVFLQAAGGRTDENIYWKLENRLKALESAVDSCLGANGAIYAMRAPLFWRDVPSNTIIDDFVLGMKVRQQGYRMVYEPCAVAVEELPPFVSHEWKRRVRIGAGDFQAIGLCRACLSPAFGAFAWAFWSHKVLRWFTPHLMLLGLTLSIASALSDRPAAGLLFVALYAAFATAAALGLLLRKSAAAPARLLRGVQYLLAMQAALFAGFLRFCRGNLEGRWQRTAR